MANVSCILRQRGVQLIFAYSWARPTILVTGKGRGECFISSVSSLSSMYLFLPCPFLLSLISLFSLSLEDDKNTHPPVVYSTNRSKAVVPVLVLLFVALWFILGGDLFYVLPCVILFLCCCLFFSVLFALRLPRLG